MKYLSFRASSGVESVGVLVDDRVVDVGSQLSAHNEGISAMRRLLLSRAGRLGTSAADLADLPSFDLSQVHLLPPVPDPTKIVAAPVNYLDHKAEMNEDAHIDALGVFLKAPSSVIASGATVRLPYTDRRFDQEGELAIVVGRPARDISVSEAIDYVAGYTCLLDMTMRGGEDRSTRKSFDTFTPVGPYLVTPDEVGEPGDLRLRTWVNGHLRQDADVSDLIWGVPKLLSYVSSVMTLNPGDIVTTGTPAGVGQVHDRDTLTVEISHVGRLHARVSATAATSCPTLGADRGPRPPSHVTPLRRSLTTRD